MVDAVLPSMLAGLDSEDSGGLLLHFLISLRSVLSFGLLYVTSLSIGVAMEGLRQLIAVRGHMVLPVLIPSLTSPPLTPFKV